MLWHKIKINKLPLLLSCESKARGTRSEGTRFARGNSAIEVMAVIVFVIAVIIAFRGYIERGFAGHWKAAGDAIGQGRQYDPRGFGSTGESGGTLDCFRDTVVDDITYQHWIDEDCYRKNNCDCSFRKFDGTKLADYGRRCEACKQSCQDDTRCQ